MFRACLILMLAISFSYCSHRVIHVENNTTESAIPVLRISGDTSLAELSVSSMKVTVKVAGNIARTTFDLSFYNPLDRILEGELDFPLADGQTIFRYALEVNGTLRDGVVVEKTKARVAFENTIRQKIDPGLVEKTKGNNFRTRLYPIPAKGYKRVVIGMEQALPFAAGAYQYQLPLFAKSAVSHFQLEAEILNPQQNPRLERNELSGFSFSQRGKTHEGEIVLKDFQPNQVFAFDLPVQRDGKPVVFTETKENKTWFYTNVPVKPQPKEAEEASTICMLWDISASSEKRNRVKELDFIKTWLSKKNAKLLLVPFHISAEPLQEFTISNGHSKELLKYLSELEPDGGTQLGALDLNQYKADEFLLFSDGLSTFGRSEIILSSRPVHVVHASTEADHAYLKYISRQTNGQYIDLTRMNAEEAFSAIRHQSLRLISVDQKPGQAEQVITRYDPAGGTVSISGILKSNSAALTLRLGYDEKTITEVKEISIELPDSSTGGIGRTWASMKIEELEPQYEKNKKEITALGKEFSIVTRNTSLLVLDLVEDYVQYEILPPPELQKEYFALLKQKQNIEKDDKAIAFEEALQAMNDLKEWWNNSGNNKVTMEATATDSLLNISVNDQNENTSLNYLMPDTTAAALSYSMAQRSPPPSAPVESNEMLLSAPLANADVKVVEELKETTISRKDEELSNEIRLSPWTSHAPYLEELEKTPVKDRWKTYRKLKIQYHDQPSFFADVARLFFESNERAKALRILSNIAEIKLEDPELLRNMAYQLVEMKEMDLAIETFREILKIREEEPHAYRDLATALNDSGKYNEAVDLLYQLILGKWDERFGDVKAIALNEMNAIISSHPNEINTKQIDPRFIYAMPVDVRIVIGWSADNSDIDLWVTDPRKEKCFYQHPETRLGGKLSRDVTAGYGPEEYCLKKAAKGDYSIEVNLYGSTRQTMGGPITILADLYTDFGKPGQKKQTINFRVKDVNEVVRIGSMKFGS